MTLLEIQEQLNNEPPLRVRGLLRKRKETLRDFMIKFFTKWNNEHETIYTGNGHTQTETGKRRSIGDIYRVCKYYYPKTTLKEVKDTIIDLFNTSAIERFRSSECGQIHKRVYYVGTPSQSSSIYDRGEANEYGYTWDEWRAL